MAKWIKRKWLEEDAGLAPGFKGLAGENIAYRQLVKRGDGDNDFDVADAYEQVTAVCAAPDGIDSGDYGQFGRGGVVKATAAVDIKQGDFICASADGKIQPYGFGKAKVLATMDGGGITASPANDGIEVLSSSASDTDQIIRIWGFRNGATTVAVYEDVALNGTTVVPTTITDWFHVYGIEVIAGSALVGTVTARDASGDTTIDTIAAGETVSGGVTIIPNTNDARRVNFQYIKIFHSRTSGTLNDGRMIIAGYDANGDRLTIVQDLTSGDPECQIISTRFKTIDRLMMGVHATGNTITFTVDPDNEASYTDVVCGYAFEDIAEGEEGEFFFSPPRSSYSFGKIRPEDCANEFYQTKTITLSASDITTGSNSHVLQVVTEPNHKIIFLGALLHYEYDTAAFAVGSDDDLHIVLNGGGGDVGWCELTNFIDQTQDEYRWVYPSNEAGTLSAVKLPVNNADDGSLVVVFQTYQPSAGGSSKLHIKVYYRTIDIDLS